MMRVSSRFVTLLSKPGRNTVSLLKQQQQQQTIPQPLSSSASSLLLLSDCYKLLCSTTRNFSFQSTNDKTFTRNDNDNIIEKEEKDKESSHQFWLPSQGQTIESMYDELASSYNDAVENPNHPRYIQSNLVMLDLMKQYWPTNNNNNNESINSDDSVVTVLDIGCGTGLLGKKFMQEIVPQILLSKKKNNNTKSIQFHGMDVSQEMLQQAHKNNNNNVYKKLIQGNIDDVTTWQNNFENDLADITICNGVFIYLKNFDILHEFIRTSKPNGKCILMFRHDANPIWEIKRKELEQDGKWKLLHVTETYENCPVLAAAGYDKSLCNCWVYQVLK